jgi:hypothetical protein
MGVSDFWNEASNGTKAVTIILSCCCVGLILFVILLGVLMPDLNTISQMANDSEDMNNLIKDIENDSSIINDLDNDSDIDDEDDSDSDDKDDIDLQVRITTKGKWSAHIGDATTSKGYKGKGNKTINIHEDYESIGVAAQKETNDKEPLKVEIIHDGKVVSKEITRKKYGVVSLGASV